MSYSFLLTLYTVASVRIYSKNTTLNEEFQKCSERGPPKSNNNLPRQIQSSGGG